jgi:hypothetical protein
MATPLRQIPLQDLPNLPLPSQKIRTDADVHTWKSTQGYKDYAAFVGMVNECVVGVYMPWDSGGGEELEVCTDRYFYFWIFCFWVILFVCLKASTNFHDDR